MTLLLILFVVLAIVFGLLAYFQAPSRFSWLSLAFVCYVVAWAIKNVGLG